MALPKPNLNFGTPVNPYEGLQKTLSTVTEQFNNRMREKEESERYSLEGLEKRERALTQDDQWDKSFGLQKDQFSETKAQNAHSRGISDANLKMAQETHRLSIDNLEAGKKVHANLRSILYDGASADAKQHIQKDVANRLKPELVKLGLSSFDPSRGYEAYKDKLSVEQFNNLADFKKKLDFDAVDAVIHGMSQEERASAIAKGAAQYGMNNQTDIANISKTLSIDAKSRAELDKLRDKQIEVELKAVDNINKGAAALRSASKASAAGENKYSVGLKAVNDLYGDMLTRGQTEIAANTIVSVIDSFTANGMSLSTEDVVAAVAWGKSQSHRWFETNKFPTQEELTNFILSTKDTMTKDPSYQEMVKVASMSGDQASAYIQRARELASTSSDAYKYSAATTYMDNIYGKTAERLKNNEFVKENKLVPEAAGITRDSRKQRLPAREVDGLTGAEVKVNSFGAGNVATRDLYNARIEADRANAAAINASSGLNPAYSNTSTQQLESLASNMLSYIQNPNNRMPQEQAESYAIAYKEIQDEIRLRKNNKIDDSMLRAYHEAQEAEKIRAQAAATRAAEALRIAEVDAAVEGVLAGKADIETLKRLDASTQKTILNRLTATTGITPEQQSTINKVTAALNQA